MIYKERTKSTVHLIYESLASRMILSQPDFAYYQRIKRGFEGECKFDTHTRTLSDDCLVLNDLQLENGNTEFQVDALIITAGKIQIFEVKNYSGIYQWDPVHLKKSPEFWLENPTLQLRRTRARLEILLQKLGYSMEVEAKVVFVHPEFTLVGAERIPEFVLPTELPALIKNLHLPVPPLTSLERELAQKLVALHVEASLSGRIPQYELSQMRSGVACPGCRKLGMSVKGQTLTCAQCSFGMSAREGICASVAEFQLLFPQEKVTTRAITNWCKIFSVDRVYRTLTSQYQAAGIGNGRYYF